MYELNDTAFSHALPLLLYQSIYIMYSWLYHRHCCGLGEQQDILDGQLH